jgi:hypothetical protein
MTILIEVEKSTNTQLRNVYSSPFTSPSSRSSVEINNKKINVYLSRVSFDEINGLNGLDYLNDFLSQICNYCNKVIKNEVRNDYRTILLCGHHYHTECICNCSTEHINIVRCINCFEKIDPIKNIVKYTYSTYDLNSDNVADIVNNKISKNYPFLYKRKFQDFVQEKK